MRYVALIYGNEAAFMQTSEAARAAEFQAYNAFHSEQVPTGHVIPGEALQPTMTATTIRVRDGKMLTTDGPFAETKEQLGGYYVLNCKDLDEAIALAAKIPGAWTGSIEIRPVMEIEMTAR